MAPSHQRLWMMEAFLISCLDFVSTDRLFTRTRIDIQWFTVSTRASSPLAPDFPDQSLRASSVQQYVVNFTPRVDGLSMRLAINLHEAMPLFRLAEQCILGAPHR